MRPATTTLGPTDPTARSNRAAGQRQPLRQVRHHHAEVGDRDHRRVRPGPLLPPSGRARRTRTTPTAPPPRGATRTTSRARALCRASTSSAASSRDRSSSRCTAASASSVAGCSATGANSPGASASARAHRRRDDRRRHRPPPRRGQHRRGQQFRQPVHGEERHPDHARAARRDRPQLPRRQQPPGRDARPSSSAPPPSRASAARRALARTNCACNACGRGAAVRSRHESGSHPPIVRFGCDSGVRLVHLALAALPVLARGA